MSSAERSKTNDATGAPFTPNAGATRRVTSDSHASSSLVRSYASSITPIRSTDFNLAMIEVARAYGQALGDRERSVIQMTMSSKPGTCSSRHVDNRKSTGKACHIFGERVPRLHEDLRGRAR